MTHTKGKINYYRRHLDMSNNEQQAICNLAEEYLDRANEYEEKYDKAFEANAKNLSQITELLEALKEITLLPESIGHAYQMKQIAEQAIKKAEE